MPATPIIVYKGPFQGAEASVPSRAFGTALTTVGTSPLTGIAQVAAAEMSFINDGYTILFIITAAVTPNLTITAIPDNAGRAVNIGPTALSQNQTRAFGPFRPLWWNSGGTMLVTLSAAANVSVAAVSFQF